jgi:hypothetical protein
MAILSIERLASKAWVKTQTTALRLTRIWSRNFQRTCVFRGALVRFFRLEQGALSAFATNHSDNSTPIKFSKKLGQKRGNKNDSGNSGVVLED